MVPISCSYQDPFEEYKKRLAKRLARQAAVAKGAPKEENTTVASDMNWFGEKVGLNKALNMAGDDVISAVGKYLQHSSKRPASVSAKADAPGIGVSETPSKKRKLGFGNFDGW